jgi:hypothetical protein
MNAHLFRLMFFFFWAMAACSSPKKAQKASEAGHPVKNAAEDNPTLDKLTAKLLDDNTFLLQGISTDTTYGYHPTNAIKTSGGPVNERRYLNALLGPNGEPVSYHRRRSCCPVKSDNGIMGVAMLDEYEVHYPGMKKPVLLYINMYDPGILKAPVGFTYKK